MLKKSSTGQLANSLAGGQIARAAMVAALTVSTVTTASALTLDEAQEGGVTIGFANEFPFSFAESDGSIAGAEYELALAVFGELGVENVEAELTEFRSLIPGLAAGRLDVVVAGLYINPDRCEQVAFTEPNMRIQWTALVAAGNPHGISGFDDIAANPDLTIAAIQGTAAERTVRGQGVDDDQLSLYPAFPEALAALRVGRVDAMTTSSVTAGNYVSGDTSGSIERADPFRAPIVDGTPVVNYTAFAFRTDDLELRDAFNEALVSFMQSDARREIFARYGLTENEVPGDDISIEALCN